jgi:hypothetical protein
VYIYFKFQISNEYVGKRDMLRGSLHGSVVCVEQVDKPEKGRKKIIQKNLCMQNTGEGTVIWK